MKRERQGTVRAAIYARRSRADEQHQSIQTQVNLCKAEIEHRGWQLAGIFTDDISASKKGMDQRPGLSRLIEAVDRGEVDAIVAWERSRFARKPYEWVFFLRDMRRKGVTVHFVNQNDPLAGPEGDLQENIIAAIDEYESIRMGMRVRSKRQEMVRNGRWPGGRLPFGYRRQGDQIVPGPEAEIVRVAFDLAANSGWGRLRICHYLNEHYPGGRNSGRPWIQASVREMLTNKLYAGYIVMRSTDYEGNPIVIEQRLDNIVPIIDEDTFNRVQLQIQRRREQQEAPRHRSTQFLLSGLVRCSNCGHRLQGKHNVRRYIARDGSERVYLYAKYVCSRAMQGAECSWHGSVSKKTLEDAAAKAISRVAAALDPEAVIACWTDLVRRQQHERQLQIASLGRELASLEAEAARWEDRILKSESPVAIKRFEQRLEATLQRYEETKERLAQARNMLENGQLASISVNEVVGLLKRWDAIFAEADVDKKRALFLELIEEAVFEPWEKVLTVKVRIGPGDEFSCFLGGSGSRTTLITQNGQLRLVQTVSIPLAA